MVVAKGVGGGSPVHENRGCSELYRIPMVEYKLDSEGTPCEYKTPFRRNTTWHRVPTPAGQPLTRGSPTQGPDRLPCQQLLQQGQAPIPRSTSFDRKLQDGPRVMQDLDSPQIPSCNKADPSQHYRSSPSNQSSSSDPGPCGSSAWAQQAGYEGCQSPVLHDRTGDGMGGHADGEVLREREPTLERTRSAGLQKEGGKDSPNKLPRGVDKSCPSHCSSHSSSNTLSSNASSNSDDKHFGSGDLMDPELLGLTYIKGASTDSGIDTAPCMPPPPLAGVGGARVILQGRGGEQVLGWAAEHPEDGGPEEDQPKLYLPQGYISAMAEGSIGDLSEISSHSSGSHHSGSPSARSSKMSASLDSSKVYIVTQASAAPGASPDSRSCPRQAPGNKYLIGWKKAEDSPPLDEPGRLAECGRLYAPEVAGSMQMSGHDGSKIPQSLSKEDSMLDQALPNDILFSSTSPFHSTLPPRMSLSQGASNLRSEFWYSDGSLADKSKFSDPGLMPLPDTASGLDWNHLVDAARAFEDQRVSSFCSMTDMQQAQALQLSQELSRRVAAAEDAALEEGEGSHGTLTGKVNQLEVILRQLQYDLRKEKEDKAMLQEQVQHLRQDNMRLHEESQTAAAQLRKFTEWFFHSIDKKP
ncbi:hypothetical protein JZ751_027150 [Albula glossodonta]|uniref:Signal-induced proliferation-associated 1-like protein C-terminal domain-containing protein n=1 Tax=Albula glossodonta TaxID=121402 RepID=A0A8T2NDN1_9TELE|nr:hypothetical protein JZ751_027150 [Albula glossodonta]